MLNSLILVLLSMSHIQAFPKESFEDLVYEYYTFTNPQAYEDYPVERDLEPQDETGEISAPSVQPQKEDFGLTLNGMMAALSEIQERGDNMLEGVRVQQEKLDALNAQIESLKAEKDALEVIVVQLRQAKTKHIRELDSLRSEKSKLTSDLDYLQLEQDAVVLSVEEGNLEMTRMKTKMAPIENTISQRRIELASFDSKIQAKQNELRKIQESLENLAGSVSEKDGSITVAVPATPAADSSPLVLLLAVSLVGNLVLGFPYITQLLQEVTSRSDMQFGPEFLENITKMAPELLNVNLSDKVTQYTSMIKKSVKPVHKSNKNPPKKSIKPKPSSAKNPPLKKRPIRKNQPKRNPIQEPLSQFSPAWMEGFDSRLGSRYGQDEYYELPRQF